jgi:uncharacterized protein (TIGR02246 family)
LRRLGAHRPDSLALTKAYSKGIFFCTSTLSLEVSMLFPLSCSLLCCAVISVIAVAGCRTGTNDQPRPQISAQPPDTKAADQAAIRAASTAWSQASAAKDVDKSISFYTEDVVMMPPKAAVVNGKEAARQGWTQMLALPGSGLTFQTTAVEVARSGDLAYETGTYDFLITDKKGNATDEKGKYVVVWKKQGNGSWKAAVDIYNPDK